MRELAVFYCQLCGYYAYYQTERHPSCPKCGAQKNMTPLKIHYSEFMHMSCRERDEYLSMEILNLNPSLMERLTAPHHQYNSREIIAELSVEIMRLETENKKLNDTLRWMHDTIWEMIRGRRGSFQREAAMAKIEPLRIVPGVNCELHSEQ